MFIVHTGRVEVVKNLAKPNQTLLAVFGPRDFMGEMSIIECVTRSASVRALEKTSLFGLRGIDLYRLFQRRPDQYAIVILNIARDLSRRLRALDEKYSVIAWRPQDTGLVRFTRAFAARQESRYLCLVSWFPI